MGRLNYERAARRQLVSTRGGDPINGPGGFRKRRRRPKGTTNWRWITAKYEGECVSKGCAIEPGDRCRFNSGTRVLQCAACAEEFGQKDPNA